MVVFLVVSASGEGYRTGGFTIPIGNDLIDKFATIIPMELLDGEKRAPKLSLRTQKVSR
jgi:hypothetical protein